MSLRDAIVQIGIALMIAGGLVGLLSYYIKNDITSSIASIGVQMVGIEIAFFGWWWPFRNDPECIPINSRPVNAVIADILRDEPKEASI